MDQAVAAAPEAALSEGPATLLRLTAEQVGMMVDAGMFKGRVELREGVLYRMSAQAVPHLTAKTAVFLMLHDALRGLDLPFRVDQEGSVLVDEHNLPEPDIIVWEPMRTRGFIPVARVGLVVEICNTTHADDLGWKSALYAGGGIPEYWVVDLPGRAVHQRWAPADGGYTQARVVAFGDAITSATLPGVSVATAALLELDAPE